MNFITPPLVVCFPADSLLPLDQWVFNTEAHPLPMLGSAADAAVRQHYVQLRTIADAHAARDRMMDGTADRHSSSGSNALLVPDSSGSGATANANEHAGDSTQQQRLAARQAFDAAAAAFGCRLQMQPNATGQQGPPCRRLNPLQAYIRMWRLRQTSELAGPAQSDVDQQVLLSNRQAAVNADIAVCEAELGLLLRQEQAAHGAVA